jgi:hypothetical protein
MQVAVDRPEVGIGHTGVLAPGHWRSARVGSAPAKTLDEFVLCQDVGDRSEVGRDEGSLRLFKRQSARERRTHEAAREPVALRVAAGAVRQGMRKVTAVLRGALGRDAHGRRRRRFAGRKEQGDADRAKEAQAMAGRRPRHRWHGAQIREDGAQVIVGKLGERHERNERPAGTRDAVAQASHQGVVAQCPDSIVGVAGDVGRHRRAERSEIEVPATPKIVAVTCTAVRRPVDEVASALHESGILRSVNTRVRYGQHHGAAGSEGEAGGADGGKIFRAIAHRCMVLAPRPAAPRLFGEAPDPAVSRRAPFTARTGRSPKSAGVASRSDPHLNE